MRRLLLAACVLCAIVTSAFRSDFSKGKCISQLHHQVNSATISAELIGGVWTYQYSLLYDSCFILPDLKSVTKRVKYYGIQDSSAIQDSIFLRLRKQDRFRNVGADLVDSGGNVTKTFPSNYPSASDSTHWFEVKHNRPNKKNNKVYDYYIVAFGNDSMLLVTGRMYEGLEMEAPWIHHLFVRVR